MEDQQDPQILYSDRLGDLLEKSGVHIAVPSPISTEEPIDLATAEQFWYDWLETIEWVAARIN